MIHSHDRGGELEALVDAGDLKGLLRAVTLEEIAEAWCCYVDRSADDIEDPDWWAIDFWTTLAFTDESVARDGLMALVDAAVSEMAIAVVGAGPLEAFIRADEDRIAWIEAQAAGAPRFREALSVVDTWGCDPRWVSERLERAAGVPLPGPRHPFPGSRPARR